MPTLLDDPKFLEFIVEARDGSWRSRETAETEIPANNGGPYPFYDDTRWPQWKYEHTLYGSNPRFGCELFFEQNGNLWIPIMQRSYSRHTQGEETQVKKALVYIEERRKKTYDQCLIHDPKAPVPVGNGHELVHIGDGLARVTKWSRINEFMMFFEESISSISTNMIYYHLTFQICCLR